MNSELPQRPLVLVVDDDSRAANVLARLLRADGYETEVAFDGSAALARLTAGPTPHAIVTDFHLPKSSGLTVARYARFRRPSIAIIVVTGYPHDLARALDPQDSPVIVLPKPLEYGALLHRLIEGLGVR
jgi:CheY-like chemotaxis protein